MSAGAPGAHHIDRRARLAARLEAGSAGAAAGALARLWERWADPVRPVAVPPGLAVVGLGGATLGGAGKTPLALALARGLAARGVSVAVVTQPHGVARPRAGARAGVPVDPADADAGDEARWLARELGPGVPVLSGRDRGALLAALPGGTALALVDGLLQARPARLALSLLVLDAARPWGADRCPPAGDRRAARERLLSAADAVVLVGGAAARVDERGGSRAADPADPAAALAALASGRGLAVYRAVSEPVTRARHAGRVATLDELAGARVGVLLATARPERVLAALPAALAPALIVVAADHAAPRPPRGARVELWLAPGKTAAALPERLAGAPVWALEHRLTPDEDLVARVLGAAGKPPVPRRSDPGGGPGADPVASTA